MKAVTNSKNAKFVNVKNVKPEVRSEKMGLMDSTKIWAKASIGKKAKSKKQKPISSAITWRSSNPKIATVSITGKIESKEKAGTCYIYSIAHNGVKGKTKVIVKDYAKPKAFDYSRMEPVMAKILKENKNDICNIASYFTAVNPEVFVTIEYDDGKLILDPVYLKTDNIKKALTNLLAKYDGALSIFIVDNSIRFSYDEVVGYYEPEDETTDPEPMYKNHNVEFMFYIDIYDLEEIEDEYDLYKDIADHWIYYIAPEED